MNGLAVVPFHPFAQVENIGAVRLVIVPALGEGGNDLIIAVVRGQSVEEQQVDLAVLVHRGIDARVVGRAVDERGRRVVGRVAAAPAAGGEGEEHREGQQKSQRFFHGKLLFREKLGNTAPSDAAKNAIICSIGEILTRHKPGGGYDGQSFSKKSRRATEISPIFDLFGLFANRACTFHAAMVQYYAENTAKEFAFYEIRYRRK